MPITGRLIADLLETAGADRFLTVDLHAGQVQGFFKVPVDELTAMPMLSKFSSRKNWKLPSSYLLISAVRNAHATLLTSWMHHLPSLRTSNRKRR